MALSIVTRVFHRRQLSRVEFVRICYTGPAISAVTIRRVISGAVKSEFVAKLRPGFYASIARSEHEFRYSRFTGHPLGYARVSTSDQDVALQVDALNAAGCYRVFVDIISGSLDSRPELDKLLDQIRPGDTLVVWRLDRLGRSIRHLIDQLATLAEREVGFRSLQETIDTNSPGGRLVFHVFAALAEFERDLIKERTHAGLTAARARGRTGGRPPQLTENQVKTARRMHAEQEITVAAIGEVLGVSRTTIYRTLKQDPDTPKRRKPRVTPAT